MQKLIIGFYVCLLCLTQYGNNQSTELENFLLDLNTWTSYLSENEMVTDRFAFTIRTTLNHDEANKFKERIEQLQENNASASESVELIPQQNTNAVQVVYTISGDHLDESDRTFVFERLSDKSLRNYLKNGFFYSCFQVQFNDNISSNLFFVKIRLDFAIDDRNILEESGFYVLGGKSERLSTTLSNDPKAINIQLSIREEVERTTLTIGTPILVIEY